MSCPTTASPWEFETGQGFTEPPECIAARVDSVIHDAAVWPSEDVWPPSYHGSFQR